MPHKALFIIVTTIMLIGFTDYLAVSVGEPTDTISFEGTSPFAMHFNPPEALRKQRYLIGTYINDLNIRWLRSSIFNWHNMEPRNGTFAFAKFDPLIDELRKYHVNILGTFHPASGWGIDNERGFAIYADKLERFTGKRPKAPPSGTVFGGPPKNWNDWYDFVFETVKHYREKGIRHWQIGNEHDSPGYWWGTAEDYVKMLKVSYKAVKAADPQATIVLAGWTSEGVTRMQENPNHPIAKEIARFIKTVMRDGASYFDVVDLHFYGDYRTIPERIQWFKDMMSTYGYTKPLWTTELGGPDDRVTPFTEQKHQEETVKRHAIVFANGIRKAFQFSLFNMPKKLGQPQTYNQLGFIDDETLQEKPAYNTYALMRHKLDGFTSVERLNISPSQDVFAYRFIIPSRIVWVLWSEQETTVNLAHYFKSPMVNMTDVFGAMTQAEASRVRLTSSPIFVEEAVR